MTRAVKTYWVLLGLFVLALFVHVRFLGGGLARLALQDEYAYEQSVEITGALAGVRLAMFVPAPSAALEIRDESFAAADLDLEIQEAGGDRQLVLRGRPGSAGRRVRYAAQLRTLPVSYALEPDLPWERPAAGDSAWLAATPTVQTDHEEIGALLARLFAVADPEAPTWTAAAWREHLAGRGNGPASALRTIYDHAHGAVAPAAFSGTTDALTALRLGESSCGGKSRLMVAALRRLGIPARIVGGVILGQPGRRRAHHLWVEARIAGTWVPCDPLNGYFAAKPARFAVLYRGDQALIRHSRGLTFDYGFRSERQRVPLVWLRSPHDARSADLRAAAADHPYLIPLLERRNFSAILLAPFALLLIVFARQVVGFESIGTFLPILLGYSLIQADWVVTGLQMALAIALGILMRFLLGRLNLLHVPRTAVMITFVVLVYLAFSAGIGEGDSFAGVGAVILPLAALAMAVEKFTIVAMDKGTRDAVWLLLQTVVLALGCRMVMVTPFFQNLIIAFPEVLILLVAMIILVGHYRGLRWKEIWRFRRVPPREAA